MINRNYITVEEQLCTNVKWFNFKKILKRNKDKLLTATLGILILIVWIGILDICSLI